MHTIEVDLREFADDLICHVRSDFVRDCSWMPQHSRISLSTMLQKKRKAKEMRKRKQHSIQSEARNRYLSTFPTTARLPWLSKSHSGLRCSRSFSFPSVFMFIHACPIKDSTTRFYFACNLSCSHSRELMCIYEDDRAKRDLVKRHEMTRQ